MTQLKEILKPGDLIAYKPKGFFGWIISVKTWHRVSHVEVYVGNDYSVASRDGIGVGYYRLRTNGVYGVYRPNIPFNLEAAMDWFWKEANGQKYDWKGILGFSTIVKQGDARKQFCSEMATRFYRRGGLEPFSKDEDADKIAPFQMTITPVFDKVK